jgi:serine phosphatase RsbU (regulator of sigma subunit)
MMRTVVESLTGILQAKAGLLMIAGGTIYTKHRETSDALLHLEHKLRESEESALALFHPRRIQPNEFARHLSLVPILWRDHIIGLLAFDIRRRRLHANERAMLRVLANQLAAAFGSVSSSPSSTHESMPLHRSLRDAACVQESLLPAIPSPHICGLSIAAFSVPADIVGGDYYDLICVGPQRLGIVLADIQGKGIAAALFGNLLRTTTHFLTHETPSPAILLGKINTILHREAAYSRKLFTMFYAIFDAKTSTLTYSGSGHAYPLVLSRHTPAIRRLRSDGTLLGVSSFQRFREHSIQLASGDTVVYFTDGVIEHGSHAGDGFGEDRFLQCLMRLREQDPEAIVSGVKESLNAFAPLPSTDDITVVVTKVP